MSITRKWSQSPVAWAAALALILPFAFGTVHAAEPAKPAKPAASAEAPVPPPTLDSDGDGKMDAWDRDGNGKADHDRESKAQCRFHKRHLARRPKGRRG